MSKYKWENPYEWAKEHITSIDNIETLKSIILGLLYSFDFDTIQSFFEDEMAEDGYFDEIEQ